MFLCKVAIGAAYTTSAESLDEPAVKRVLASGARDAIVGLTKRDGGALNYDETVVFRDEAAIPSYLVVYRLDGRGGLDGDLTRQRDKAKARGAFVLVQGVPITGGQVRKPCHIDSNATTVATWVDESGVLHAEHEKPHHCAFVSAGERDAAGYPHHPGFASAFQLRVADGAPMSEEVRELGSVLPWCRWGAACPCVSGGCAKRHSAAAVELAERLGITAALRALGGVWVEPPAS